MESLQLAHWGLKSDKTIHEVRKKRRQKTNRSLPIKKICQNQLCAISTPIIYCNTSLIIIIIKNI
jgi:hypothetical protein